MKGVIYLSSKIMYIRGFIRTSVDDADTWVDDLIDWAEGRGEELILIRAIGMEELDDEEVEVIADSLVTNGIEDEFGIALRIEDNGVDNSDQE